MEYGLFLVGSNIGYWQWQLLLLFLQDRVAVGIFEGAVVGSKTYNNIIAVARALVFV